LGQARLVLEAAYLVAPRELLTRLTYKTLAVLTHVPRSRVKSRTENTSAKKLQRAWAEKRKPAALVDVFSKHHVPSRHQE
jgi:hypothetical protein